MRALRLVCLHGFRSNGAALRAQLRGLVAGAQPELELLCPDAPALATGGSGWWNAVPLEPTALSDAAPSDPALATRAKHYQGWEQTRAWLVAFFGEHGPIDGVLGFSQGAALTGLLVGLRSPSGIPTLAQPLAFDFAILIGGFVSNDPAHAALYAAAESYALPTLHVIGRADGIVTSEASLSLAARFANPQLAMHDGGHVIASTEAVRAVLTAFLSSAASARR
jgi:pimeloyl-ACP methyl ester carboxylesterase